MEAIGRALLGDDYDTFSTDLLDQTFEIMGATKQMDRLNKLGIWLESKSALPCAAGLSVRIQKSPHECRKGTDAGDADTFLTPSSVLRPGGTITVAWPVDNQIDTHGPYDAESFPDKRVKIAVICPEEFIGEAGQFLKQFKDGFPSADEKARFRQGFVRKYHLNSCDFSFHAVKRTSSSLEEAYKAASFEALKEKPNLAVAIIREQHRELPDAENPYYTTKARLMAQGVPVQLIEIETIRQSGRAFILNNLSVAMYAKLGGIPWTLTPNQDMVHEIVVGIGSARLSDSRRGAGERVICLPRQLTGYLDSLGLPSKNVLVPPTERWRVSLNLPDAIELIDNGDRVNATYISKFVAAVAAGLFDAALNFLWNETVANLRLKVARFDLDYF